MPNIPHIFRRFDVGRLLLEKPHAIARRSDPNRISANDGLRPTPSTAALLNRAAASPGIWRVLHLTLPGSQSSHAARTQGGTRSWRLLASRKQPPVRALEDDPRQYLGKEKHAPFAFLPQVARVADAPRKRRCGTRTFDIKCGMLASVSPRPARRNSTFEQRAACSITSSTRFHGRKDPA